MDETLIHCHTDEKKPCDVVLTMNFDGRECKVSPVSAVSHF
jgi:CTD small phosphatase-like protein 2